jgi:metallo-beta-lactamase family protein
LVREGFQGSILSTPATSDLSRILLQDAAEIQMEDAAHKRRRHQKEGRKGKYPEIPLYDDQDVVQTLPRYQGVPYGESVQIGEGVHVTFHEAGHILGSAMLELNVTENGESRRLVFSGDIGQWGKPLIRDPTLFEAADYVVMESTYGDRNHDNGVDIESHLADVISSTINAGGNVVIPTFAVERAQELMYYLGRLTQDGRIADVPVFLDSPMAADVTEVFRQHRDVYDEEAWKRYASGDPPLKFPGLHTCRTTAQSKTINEVDGPAVIMATSGMCTAGRIKHHLRHNIGRPECTVLFVGYQGRGTLGRQILDGNANVRIHGKQYPVRARIAQIHGFSGHADHDALMRWLGSFRAPPRHLFLTHGEEDVALGLAQTIYDTMNWHVSVPQYREVVDLT